MKKIVISSNTAWTIFNHRAGLIRTLQEAGYEVHTVAPESNFTDIKNPGTVFHSVKNLERKGKNPFSDLLLILEYFRIYRNIKPDCVLTYTPKPNIYSAFACRMAGIPIICTVNGLGTGFDDPESRTYKIITMLFRLAFRKVAAVVFQNPDDRQFFIDKKITSGENSRLVNGSGVDLAKFHFIPAAENDKFILISRMLKNKGVGEFIEAGQRLHMEFPAAEFVLLGPADPDNPAGIRQEILDGLDGKNGVLYAGAVKDVRPYLESSSAVVLPSYYREGIPKTLIEALAAGRPVITTDMPGCRETLLDGQNGFFVKPRSADDLYSVMKKFIQMDHGDRLAMGRQSRLLAEEKFDEKKVIAEYIGIIDKILNN